LLLFSLLSEDGGCRFPVTAATYLPVAALHHIPICTHFHRLEYLLLINGQLPVMCVVQYLC
jgi:hypothetical protein